MTVKQTETGWIYDVGSVNVFDDTVMPCFPLQVRLSTSRGTPLIQSRWRPAPTNKPMFKMWLLSASPRLFSQATRLDDQLPVEADGGVRYIHVTAVSSAMDSVLTAAHSNDSTCVLTPMKPVVKAVFAIVKDVWSLSGERSKVDQDALRALRERAGTTLSNVVTFSKTHAISSGMSFIGLLDAATRLSWWR